MSKESKEQQLDQLLRGVYRMCVNRDDCNGCPFYITKCTFEEPSPWNRKLPRPPQNRLRQR